MARWCHVDLWYRYDYDGSGFFDYVLTCRPAVISSRVEEIQQGWDMVTFSIGKILRVLATCRSVVVVVVVVVGLVENTKYGGHVDL